MQERKSLTYKPEHIQELREAFERSDQETPDERCKRKLGLSSHPDSTILLEGRNVTAVAPSRRFIRDVCKINGMTRKQVKKQLRKNKREEGQCK